MGNRSTVPEGHGKLLSAWEPPAEAGEPVGCLATTFTFSPAFFEEECLGRFLKLETDATEDGPVYLVEREEKLAQVVCAAVIVDQHHCKGTRSLRWDLHAARLEDGIQHSKISLLCWSKMVRLIIASANLTEDGYRRNREVYGVLDFHEGAPAPRQVLHDVIEFLRQIANMTISDTDSLPLRRMREFLDQVGRMSPTWGTTQDEHRREPLQLVPLLTGTERADLFTQMKAIWPGGSNPPDLAWVLSPFFDPPEAKTNAPAESLWTIMRKRGDATVTYCVETEAASEEGKFFTHAPASLLTSRPTRETCSVQFSALVSETGRPLHAKELWLEDDRWVLFLIGSSNFTSPGTGVGETKNFEANLVYLFDKDRAPRGSYSEMKQRLPKSEPVEDPGGTLQFKPQTDAGIDAAQETQLLPPGFLSATYRTKETAQGEVILVFGDRLHRGWQILDEEEKSVLTESDWKKAGAFKSYSMVWTGRPPSGFWVTWPNAKGNAWWPVNVASTTDLPPPDELRDLPLDVLINILTSARPLHETLRGYLKRKKQPQSGGSEASGVELDPHKRVDTSGFLLQRTRRFSWALTGLRSRLERPVPTEECLQWRIHGPVGVMAVASALTREAKSDDEQAFLLAELALELLRVKPQDSPGALSSRKVRKELRIVACQLRAKLALPNDRRQGSLSHYLARVQERIGKS